MVIKLSFSRMSSSNQSVLVLKSASYRDIHAGPLLLKSWKFEILDNNDLAIRSKLASLIFRNSVKFLKYSQLSKLKMGHRKNFKFFGARACFTFAEMCLKWAIHMKKTQWMTNLTRKLHKNAQFSNKGLFLKDLEVKIWSNAEALALDLSPWWLKWLKIVSFCDIFETRWIKEGSFQGYSDRITSVEYSIFKSFGLKWSFFGLKWPSNMVISYQMINFSLF